MKISVRLINKQPAKLTEINRIRNEREIVTDGIEIQRMKDTVMNYIPINLITWRNKFLHHYSLTKTKPEELSTPITIQTLKQ